MWSTVGTFFLFALVLVAPTDAKDLTVEMKPPKNLSRVATLRITEGKHASTKKIIERGKWNVDQLRQALTSRLRAHTSGFFGDGNELTLEYRITGFSWALGRVVDIGVDVSFRDARGNEVGIISVGRLEVVDDSLDRAVEGLIDWVARNIAKYAKQNYGIKK